MKKFFSILAAVLFAGSMMAAEVTVTKSIHDLFPNDENGTQEALLYSDEAISISVNDDGNNGKVYGTGTEWRLYQSNNAVVTVAATNATIKTVAFEFTVKNTAVLNFGGAAMTSNTAVNVNATSAQFVVANSGAATNGQVIIKSFTVVYEAGAAPAVSTPVITGEESFYETAEISIACSTEGAKVYYTLDGAEPTAESALYADPFEINATTTVKAIAIKGEDKSDVATKTFTKKEPLVAISCAEVYSKAKGDELALNNVVVAYANGKNVYVQDETGSMLLYLTKNTTWEAGNILSGVQGTLDIYNGLYEVKMTDAQATSVQPGQGEAPAPAEFNAAPVAADMNKYIVLKNVTVSAETFPSNKNMDCTIGEESFVLRNNFNANAAFDITKKYDIIGVVAVYNSTVQVYFVSAEEVQATAINNNTVADKVQKVVRDGQLYIIRDGKMINVLGAQF